MSMFNTHSIGGRLLMAFAAMALLVIASASIGVVGFSLVSKTERNVVTKAIPSMIEARQVAELSARMVSSVQLLANAQTELERQQAGQQLFTKLESLLNHIRALGADSFDTELLNQLEVNVESIIDTLANLGIAVEKRLLLSEDIHQRLLLMREVGRELEGLTRTQVLNTSTVAVANVTQIYGLVNSSDQEEVYNALDNLVEVDLDLSDRLHELHLLAFQILNQIEELRSATDAQRIADIRHSYNDNLTIMQRRVSAVEDPTRHQQMVSIIDDLQAKQIVFELIAQRESNSAQSQTFLSNALEQFAALNQTVSQLVDESNQVTTDSVVDLKQTLEQARLTLAVLGILGLIIVGFIIWKLVYVSVIQRLDRYSSSLAAISDGQYPDDVPTSGSDELSQMGKAINKARDTSKALSVLVEKEAAARGELEQHKSQLEDLVFERTHQLQQSNERLNSEVVNHARARQEAESANKAKSAFLATMSHEIRTPLNGVLGTTQLLREGELSPQQAQYVEVINRSGSSLLTVLNDVLDYSKIEAGHFSLQSRAFDLKQLVEDVIGLFLAQAEQKGLQLSAQIESDVGRYWQGDSVRLHQVLSNLISNAVKFTEHGYIDLYISLDVEDETSLRFEVSDSGIGISADEQTYLFDPFSQSKSGQSKIGGTGLGLAICQKLVQAMGSQIELVSEEGQGAQFTFVVSLPKASQQALQQYQSYPSTSAESESYHILLVEDNPVNQLVAQGFLEKLGHSYQMAKDSHQAQALLEASQFDLALFDINLPDGTGVELLEWAKEQELKTMPILAVSAHVFEEEVTEYLAAGFDGFVGKPIEKQKLHNAIASVMGEEVFVTSKPAISKPESTAVADTSSKLDIETLARDYEVLGKAKVQQLIELFTSTSQETLHEMDALADGKDRETASLAHRLKGSAASLGLTRLVQLCLAIEKSPLASAEYRASSATLYEARQDAVESLQMWIDGQP
ncbi:TMAO reductase system sensor histidine kinase/response regulator TorS [Vibrio astriarenae]|uniref:TMAO reductase system sensor histidine kinase/response regulator TorS n=1 Tax=Vibrio astriarenae TaxID=1481923 RepID=UPI0037355119